MIRLLVVISLFALSLVKGYAQSGKDAGLVKNQGASVHTEKNVTNLQTIPGGAKFDGKNKSAAKPEAAKSQSDSTKGLSSFKPAKDSYIAK